MKPLIKSSSFSLTPFLPHFSHFSLASVSHAGSVASYDWSRPRVAGLPGALAYSGAGITATRLGDEKDRLDRLEYAVGAAPAAPALFADYEHHALTGRRSAVQREDGQGWSWTYNKRGEVVTATRGSASYSYSYDEIGNRRVAHTRGISQAGQATAYTTGATNTYTSIEHPDPAKFLVLGRAHPATNVTATSKAGAQTAEQPVPVARSGAAYSATASAGVADGPVWAKVSITASRSGVGLNQGYVSTLREGWQYLPPKVETLAYDDDGNLLQTARWQCAWDAENRLVSVEERHHASRPAQAPPRARLEFAYDQQGRRVRKVVRSWDSGTGQFVIGSDTRFVYDGWNMIAQERDRGR